MSSSSQQTLALQAPQPQPITLMQQLSGRHLSPEQQLQGRGNSKTISRTIQRPSTRTSFPLPHKRNPREVNHSSQSLEEVAALAVGPTSTAITTSRTPSLLQLRPRDKLPRRLSLPLFKRTRAATSSLPSEREGAAASRRKTPPRNHSFTAAPAEEEAVECKAISSSMGRHP